MSITLNPVQRAANNALKHSKGISVARRAKWRAKRGADFRFWHMWEEDLKVKMIAIAEMLERRGVR